MYTGEIQSQLQTLTQWQNQSKEEEDLENTKKEIIRFSAPAQAIPKARRGF